MRTCDVCRCQANVSLSVLLVLVVAMSIAATEGPGHTISKFLLRRRKLITSLPQPDLGLLSLVDRSAPRRRKVTDHRKVSVRAGRGCPVSPVKVEFVYVFTWLLSNTAFVKGPFHT